MTRFIHDRFAKDYLEALLAPYGEVRADRKIRSEPREIDLLFIPSAAIDRNLGLLARLAETAAIFEPFRNPATTEEIGGCLLKALELRGERQRRARRKGVTETVSPSRLWILTPTASTTILEEFRALTEENYPPGIYFLAPFFQTAIVVIHQLPRTPDTLWLRVLGRGTVQERAIDELESLPADDPIRTKTLELFYQLQENLRSNQRLEEEDRELIMRLQPLLEERIARVQEESKREGLREGLQRGERLVVENLLKARFGELDAELAGSIDAILELSPEEFTPLLLNLSREELTTRFGRSS